MGMLTEAYQRGVEDGHAGPQAALAAMTAERDAERGRADRAERERDEARVELSEVGGYVGNLETEADRVQDKVAAARRDALEEAARIAEADDGRRPGGNMDFGPNVPPRIAARIRAAARAATTGGRDDGR